MSDLEGERDRRDDRDRRLLHLDEVAEVGMYLYMNMTSYMHRLKLAASVGIEQSAPTARYIAMAIGYCCSPTRLCCEQ